MLVLSRSTREEIVIGEAVVTVIEIKPGKVRLGIVAPKDVSIMRRELLDEEAPPRESQPIAA